MERLFSFCVTRCWCPSNKIFRLYSAVGGDTNGGANRKEWYYIFGIRPGV